MSTHEADRLMHLVLDGEASAEEERRLERLLAADPAARARYQALGELFDQLARVPLQAPSPELSEVIIHKAGQRFGGSSISSPRTQHSQPPGVMMSQQSNGKRRIWIGVALAAQPQDVYAHED